MHTRKLVAAGLALAIIVPVGRLDADEPPRREASAGITVSFVHPERQAAAVLRLFEGSRAAHPAAALVAWKHATRNPHQLSKRLEAVISFFNPEMVREWAVLHEARLELDLDATTAAPRFRLLAPRDDGTLTALVTALRLSGGSSEPPLVESGKSAVERLGGPGSAVATLMDPKTADRGGSGLVVASSRAELGGPVHAPAVARFPPPSESLDSGFVFQVEPGSESAPATASVTLRRMIELVHALGCRAIDGRFGLIEDRLELVATSRLEPAHPLAQAANGDCAIDPRWLRYITAEEALAVVSIANGRGPAYWEGVFTLADRVDRADPARVNLAPLRSRVNLLATAAGASLEGDLWPHLKGVTASVLAAPGDPDRAGRCVAILHMDTEAAARQLFLQTLPHLARISTRFRADERPKHPQGDAPSAGLDSAGPVALGRPGGRPLEIALRGQDVVIGWGDQSLAAALRSAQTPERSVLPVLTEGWAGPQGKTPARLGALWPGRVRLPLEGLDGPTPLAQSLAEGPPLVWTGWNLGAKALDRVHWQGLSGLVHRFLARLPLDPAGLP
ncbi:MAG: hypothetical protein ACLP7Q_07675 [Isosphaeraceae bacterium]